MNNATRTNELSPRQDLYLDVAQMGAAPITVSWVSVAVLILDACAMLRAWQFAMDGRDTLALNVAIYGGLSAAPLVYLQDLFKFLARATKKGTHHRGC